MSTGSYDESSNLVKDTASPSPFSTAPNLDDVFDIGSNSNTNDKTTPGNKNPEQNQHLESQATSFSSSPSKSKHSSPFKKSKAPKGLGFLIKAREGALKGRSKSPSKSKSKKHHVDDDFDLSDIASEGGNQAQAVDDSVKAKSEHWQAFLQMQDRIKQNVLKTQTSIGKLTAGRISPSGRISPGSKDDQETNIVSEDTEEDSCPGERIPVPEASLADGSSDIFAYSPHPQFTDAANQPEISVSSPSAFHTDPERVDHSAMDNLFGDAGLGFDSMGSKTAPDNAATIAATAGAVDEFDLLGLNSDPAPPAPVTNHNSSGRSSFCEDLLGLDDFLSQPASRDLSQDNLQAMDWFGGSTQSSAQSSLCPSPVQFDIDLLTSQGRLAPDSTAVSDLARSLVDDFLQWGAGQNDASDAQTSGTLSKNPFQSDDFGAEEQVLKPNAFNPFATIVESDDADFGSDLLADHPRRESGPEQHAAFTGFDPFAPVTETSAEPLDPFLDINANAAPAPAPSVEPSTKPASSSHQQHPASKKASSRKHSNPFLITEEDFVDGAVTFDDDFFASRGIFHAAPTKDMDSIWGVGKDSGSQGQTTESNNAFSSASANPFQDDSFTAENIGAPESVGTTTSSIAQPINPFLTASFENIASQTHVKPLSADNPFAAMLGEPTPSQGEELAPVLDPLLLDSDVTGGGQLAAAVSATPAVSDIDFDPFSPQPSSQVDTNSAAASTTTEPAMAAPDLLDDAFGISSTRDPVPAPVSADPADDDDDFFSPKIKLDIREKPQQPTASGPVPMLPPPPKAPKSPQMPHRENPFDKASPPEENFASFAEVEEELRKKTEAEAAEAAAAAAAAKESRDRLKSVTSEDSTPEEEGPLAPLEPFHAAADLQRDCWKLMVRHPTKKKLAGNRFWKLTIVRLGVNKDGPVLRLFMEEKDTEPVQVSARTV